MFDFCDLWIDWQINQRRRLFEKQRRMVMSRLNKGEWGAELSVFNETPFMNRVVLFFNRLKLCESQYICSLICRRNMYEKKKKLKIAYIVMQSLYAQVSCTLTFQT